MVDVDCIAGIRIIIAVSCIGQSFALEYMQEAQPMAHLMNKTDPRVMACQP